MFSFRESSILIIKYVFRFFLLVAKLYKSVLQIIYLNSKHLRFLSSVDIGDFLQWYILKDKFYLFPFFQMFFWSVNFTSWDFLSQHVLDMTMFYLRVFSIGINFSKFY